MSGGTEGFKADLDRQIFWCARLISFVFSYYSQTSKVLTISRWVDFYCPYSKIRSDNLLSNFKLNRCLQQFKFMKQTIANKVVSLAGKKAIKFHPNYFKNGNAIKNLMTRFLYKHNWSLQPINLDYWLSFSHHLCWVC